MKRTRCRPELPAATQEAVVLDLNSIVSGPVAIDNFKNAVEAFDFSPYYDKHIQLRGCAPSWAFLMVYEKLASRVSAVDYLLDDGKRGVAIAIKTPLAPQP